MQVITFCHLLFFFSQAGCSNATFYFSGVGLSSGPGKDVVRVVSGLDCNASLVGVEPPYTSASSLSGTNLSPVYSAIFLYGGTFTMCYKVSFSI